MTKHTFLPQFETSSEEPFLGKKSRKKEDRNYLRLLGFLSFFGIFSVGTFLFFSFVHIAHGSVGYFAMGGSNDYLPPGLYFRPPWDARELKILNVDEETLYVDRVVGLSLDEYDYYVENFRVRYDIVNVSTYVVNVRQNFGYVNFQQRIVKPFLVSTMATYLNRKSLVELQKLPKSFVDSLIFDEEKLREFGIKIVDVTADDITFVQALSKRETISNETTKENVDTTIGKDETTNVPVVFTTIGNVKTTKENVETTKENVETTIGKVETTNVPIVFTTFGNVETTKENVETTKENVETTKENVETTIGKVETTNVPVVSTTIGNVDTTKGNVETTNVPIVSTSFKTR